MDVYNLVRIVFMIHGRAESQKKKKKKNTTTTLLFALIPFSFSLPFLSSGSEDRLCPFPLCIAVRSRTKANHSKRSILHQRHNGRRRSSNRLAPSSLLSQESRSKSIFLKLIGFGGSDVMWRRFVRDAAAGAAAARPRSFLCACFWWKGIGSGRAVQGRAGARRVSANRESGLAFSPILWGFRGDWVRQMMMWRRGGNNKSNFVRVNWRGLVG